jgi:hypothetical protein
MSNTWSHNCDSTGKFNLIPLEQVCPTCGINNQVEAIRHAGFMATPYQKKPTTQSRAKRIAALFMPKQKTDTTEYEKEFYDRHG